MKPYYQDSAVTIYHSDFRQVLDEIDTVDHVITDPPYGRHVYTRLRGPNTHAGSGTPQRLGIRNHQYSSGSIEKLAAGAIGDIEELLHPCAAHCARLAKRWMLVFSDAESIHIWRDALIHYGMRYVRTGAWVKPDPMPQFSGDRPCVGFEPCTITHAAGKMRWNGGGGTSVWIHNIAKGNADARPDHPCPKPLPLMLQLVSLFTDLGETILDPFAGAGTTLRAAKDLGRKAIGIEIEEKYCEIAAKRMAQEVLAFA